MKKTRKLFGRLRKAEETERNRTVPASSTSATLNKIAPLGVKLLHDSDDSIVDIVFVHGLTGHREITWTTKEAASPWPQTLLPAEIPNARIVAFGYDASISSWRSAISRNRVRNHSMNLLSALATYRYKDNTNDRPIIFVSHSLGGLVCRDALVEAKHSPEDHLRNILRSTREIVFLGTPHHGSGQAEWAEKLASSIGMLRQTNPEMASVLKKDSEILESFQNSFHSMIRSREKDGNRFIETNYLYGELPLLRVGMVVPKDSAILPGYVEVHPVANIPA